MGGARGGKTISRRALLAGAGGIAVATSIGGYVGSDSLKVHRQTLRLPRWDADGFKVALVSDIHANTASQAARALESMRAAVAERPDLIAFTGDFLDYASVEACGHVEAALNELHNAKCACYAVFGNHDYYCLNMGRLHETIRRTPMKLLYNKAVEVNGVTLVGIDDALARQCHPNRVNWNATSRSCLVLLHEPDYVNVIPQTASLQLSGHSHGGEVCLPFGIPLRLPPGATRYHTGFYADATVPLFVSRGVATCAPFRLFCPPEINVLTLYGGGAQTRTLSV